MLISNKQLTCFHQTSYQPLFWRQVGHRS